MTFVHLHVHSHYSLGKGIAAPDALARAAAERQMPALALTDQDTLAGMVEHVRACRRCGVRPLLGAEITIQYPAINGIPPAVHHLTVLLESEAGYRALVRLLNAAIRAAGAGGPPVIPFADFAAGARGLIVLTGCSRGRLFGEALTKNKEAALEHL
ncbi:MAG: PHP domain-containing protein, partial [Candidatus Sumerlaeota bacterium]|nr:PHP domain-containing protein [Candidatus Sumerlaeota bacterium]